MPKLCMFALRDIIKGEQLTFDYRQRTGKNCKQTAEKHLLQNRVHSKLYYSRIKTFENSNNNINFVLAGEDDATEVIPDEDDQGERMECRCGVTNCRKILFL